MEQDDEGGTENNIPYDREFTKLNFVHLALVDNPRYERANIVFNSKDEKDDIIDVKLNQELYKLVQQCNNNKSTLTNKDLTLLKSIYNILKRTNNGWVTLKDKVDENGKPLVVFIPSYIPSGGAALDFHRKIATEKPKANVVYEFAQTKANISEEQKSFLKSIIGNILGSFKVEPPLKGVNVCTIGGGCLGVAISSRETRTLSLDSKIFKDKGSKTFNKSVESGWLTRTDKDVITSVLTHELGHIITAGTDKKEFWDKIKEIKSEYVKNIDVEDISNKDYISKYARTNKDEFVAECFAQATLLKSPSKYAKMVLNEINNNFKLSAKEVKQLRLFNAVMEVFNMNLEFSINNDKSNKDLEITWVESEGAGYCLTEEDYKKRKKEVEQHAKEEMDK